MNMIINNVVAILLSPFGFGLSSSTQGRSQKKIRGWVLHKTCSIVLQFWFLTRKFPLNTLMLLSQSNV